MTEPTGRGPGPGEFDTRVMHSFIERMRTDPKVRDDLYRAVEGRLIRLARHMLRDFPRLAAMTEAEDILQGAAMRLIDLTRQYFGPLGQGRNEVLLGEMERVRVSGVPDRALQDNSQQELEQWTEFHEKIEELPLQEREVFSLVYYHGMNQEKIAGILGVNERTVRRYWRQAVTALKTILSPEGMAKLTRTNQ